MKKLLKINKLYDIRKFIKLYLTILALIASADALFTLPRRLLLAFIPISFGCISLGQLNLFNPKVTHLPSTHTGADLAH